MQNVQVDERKKRESVCVWVHVRACVCVCVSVRSLSRHFDTETCAM